MRKLGLLVLLSLGPACAPALVLQPPAIPTVPVTFERNLETTRRCEFRGTVNNLFAAGAVDANLVLAFVYAGYERTQNGVTTSFSGFRGGKALHCPADVVERFVAEERALAASGE